METFDEIISQRVELLREQSLHRSLRRVGSAQGTRILFEGKSFLNFSSNDYLGLANDPITREAALESVREFGTGSGASRLLSGSLAIHHQLEQELAAFKGKEAALSFSSGYATALGALPALLSREDVVVLDHRVHASLVDAARLSGARIRVFRHNCLESLERILKWTRARRNQGNSRTKVLVVTEGVFSMDGDRAPLREIVELKNKYGAWLMVDEAHATGLLGRAGQGLAAELGVSEQIEIIMGTLGKALGSAGGYICGSRVLIEFLVNSARSFIFSTAPVPAAAGAARAAIQFIRSPAGELRRRALWQRVKALETAMGIPVVQSAIVPIALGEESAALRAAALLLENGIFVPAVRFPTVPRGKARLRLTLTSAHSQEDVETLARVLREVLENVGTVSREPVPQLS